MSYLFRIKASILAVLILLLIGSCQNKDIDIETFSIATEQVRSGIDTVGIIGSYDFFKEAEAMKINIGRDSTLTDASSHAVALVGKDYSVIVRNLQANTQYYYNYSVNVGVHNDFITPTKSFRTLQAQDFTIVVSAIPNEGGTVSGGGTYTQGQQCTVTASAHEGYAFMHWTENDSVVSTDSIYRFIVTGNRVLAAQFALLITEPTVTTGEVTDITQTTAKGSGEVTNDGGAAVTERGLCWSTSHTPTVLGNHATSGTGIGTFSVDMSGLTDNTKYYVRAYATNSEGTAYGDEVEFTTLQLNNYTVSVSANPTNGGTATGGGSFQQGQSCTVRAIANTGYTFVNWTENGNQVSANVNYSFTVNGNRTLVANFTAGSYIISATVDPENSGTITGAGGYEYGQSCTLKATANTGYTFEKWTENGTQVSTNATYTFSVSGSRSLLAHFKVNSYTITVSANPAAGGVATGGGTFEYGQSCTLSATANSGYNFSNWTEGGNVVSSNSSYTFTVTGNRTLKANFTQQAPQDYTISVSANPSDGGTVTGGGTYQQGQSCTVRATANSGYTFSKWTENGNQVSTSANYTFTVNSNRTLVAHFTANPQNYTITVSADPTNGGSVSGGGSYQQGQNCTVTAAANSGYTFSNWTENGNVVSSNTSYSFIVTGNRTLVAHFIANPQSYTISVSANPTNGGSVSGGGTYQQGQSCTVTAEANSGYTFVNWTENGTQVSTNANYSFTVNSNRNLVANFQQQAPQTYTISVSADPSSGGSVSGGGTYQQGQNCIVTATANNGYSFTNWTENGSVVSTNASYSFTVTGNRTLVAHFTTNPQSYTISVSANPTNGGSVNGGGTYQQGQNCTVTATANSGFTFTNWTENGNQVSTNASYSFTINGNRSLVANFIVSTPLQPPTGAIAGLFSVSATKQVWFSQGNLQYIGSASTPYWKFAEHQWEYISGLNQGTNPNLSRDLFAWGTSGHNHGALNYQPWSGGTENSNYYAYGQAYYNLFDQTGLADWGCNPISNGGNTINTWRVLKKEEWDYVFHGRNTPSGIRYAYAVVNDVNGIILLPDSWSASIYSLNNVNPNPDGGGWYENNIINASQWSILENAGVVFFPAGGSIYGIWAQPDNNNGHYWSSSINGNDKAYGLGFASGSITSSSDTDERCERNSVRLVQDYNP